MWNLDPIIGRRLISFATHRAQFAKSHELGSSLGAIGDLEVRLARGKKEIRQAQRLRYKVFYKEGGAIPDAKVALTRRDADRYDRVCDHLIVIDRAFKSKFGIVKPKIVGVYRLLRSEVAQEVGGFYSASEYDIEPLLARHSGLRILELGRSCVLKSHRSKRTIELLWRGLLSYVRAHKIDALIGCASFPGAFPGVHSRGLSYLAHYAQADGDWDVKAKNDLYVPMATITKDKLDAVRALKELPPLIKGYLRAGAKFGDGAVVDIKFNTTDVFVIMPISEIGARYIEYFGEAERKAA